MRKRINHSPSTPPSVKRRIAFALRKGFMWLIKPRILVLIATMCFAGYHTHTFIAASDAIQRKVEAILHAHHLVVKSIYLEGQSFTPHAQIVDAMATEMNSSIFSVDIDGIKTRLEGLSWIKDASVERQLPSTLAIHITERRPTFLWQQEGVLSIVDNEGEVIAPHKAGQFPDLIILVGEDAPPIASHLLNSLAKDETLLPFISSMTYVGQRRWDIQFYNDVKVRLPEKEAAKAWQLLSQMHQDNPQLLSDVTVIDLRLSPEKIFIQ